jgi:alpha,alpha-trehalose-phosphate synthase [UDP-forming]
MERPAAAPYAWKQGASGQMWMQAQWQAALEKMAGGRLIVVSNREPFVNERQGDRVLWTEPAGGVTAALHPLLNSAGGTWIAHGSGPADREVVDRNDCVMVPPGRPAYKLRRVWIPEKEVCEYYNGIANQGLWPLCHHVYQRPRFSAAEWESYRRVNGRFAQAVLEEAAGEAGVVFVQDYHFALLPRMVKERNPRLRVVQFWHIPWPNPEVFATFPWQEELMDGLLGNDLLGFHLQRHCLNFLESAGNAMDAEVDFEFQSVERHCHATAVRDFPIGIDFEGHCARASSEKTGAAISAWKSRIGEGVRIGIGIDRMDYTKGIPERLRGLDLFFSRNPQWREKLVFIQVGVPSRCDVPAYRELASAIENQVRAINLRWGTRDWEPIRFIGRNLCMEEMIALHRLADFCLITALHDGMNLVAKEFVASRPDLKGTLILSRFAGAARELNSSILVNPFSEDEIAEAISTALELSPAERKRRMFRMRASVAENNVFRWAANIVSALVQDDTVPETAHSTPVQRMSAASVA